MYGVSTGWITRKDRIDPGFVRLQEVRRYVHFALGFFLDRSQDL